MSSAHYNHPGGGYNTLCLHPDGQLPQGANAGNQNGNLLYGMEYQNTGAADSSHDVDAACAMCQRPGARQSYVQWGRQQCTNGHTTEYNGLVMGTHYSQHKSEHVCVDYARMGHAASSTANHDGGLLYTTEMEGGAIDESAYPHDLEVGCAVCSVPPDEGSVYVRWGHRDCPSTSTTLYSGFMSGEHYGHRGGGANTLCLHPQGQLPGQDPTSHETALSLKAKSHPDHCADINHGSGDNLYMYYNCHKGDNQDFYFESWPPPARIRTRSGNKCLDYNWGNGNLYFFDCHDGSNQLWFFRDGDEKTVPYDASEARRIGSRHDNKCIDMNTGNHNLYMYDCHDGDNQKFFFDKRVKLSGNENGNLLYGMEYQNTGWAGTDKNHDVDAACAMCQRPGPSSSFVSFLEEEPPPATEEGGVAQALQPWALLD
jgi:hypothetical protein